MDESFIQELLARVSPSDAEVLSDTLDASLPLDGFKAALDDVLWSEEHRLSLHARKVVLEVLSQRSVA